MNINKTLELIKRHSVDFVGQAELKKKVRKRHKIKSEVRGRSNFSRSSFGA